MKGKSIRRHEMTEWDAGQDLIRAADDLAEIQRDFETVGRKEHAKALQLARDEIGKVFNVHHAYKSHGFGLPVKGARE